MNRIFRHPHPLTPIESYPYKNRRGRGNRPSFQHPIHIFCGGDSALTYGRPQATGNLVCCRPNVPEEIDEKGNFLRFCFLPLCPCKRKTSRPTRRANSCRWILLRAASRKRTARLWLGRFWHRRTAQEDTGNALPRVCAAIAAVTYRIRPKR